MFQSKTSMRSHKRTHIVDLIVDIMNDSSPVRPRCSQQLRMFDARSSDLPSRSRCSTVFRTPSMKRESGMRIPDVRPSWSVQRSDARHDDVLVEEKRRITVNTAANTDVHKGYHMPDIYHQAQNRYFKTCPACCKLKQFQDLQKLRLRPPCKQKTSDQKRGIAKHSSRYRKRCREQSSRRRKRHGNGHAAKPSKSRPKTNRNILRIKDSEPEVANGRNTESGSNVSSSACISSQEKLPSANNSIPDHEPMEM